MAIEAAEPAATAEGAAGAERFKRARGAAQAYGQQAGQVARGASIVPGRSRYQGVILAEFLVAELLVMLWPIASPSATSAAKGTPSPYTVSNIRQLVAIGAVYFILALIPGDTGSRWAAGFGALVLVTLLIIQANAGHLQVLLQEAGGPTEPAGGPPGVQVT